jgi:predicted enzyme related to lactoylglutathione lyase
MQPKIVYASVGQSRRGSFCPPLLGTTNQAYAKHFYAALFGWETQDFRTGPNDDGFLTLFHLQGRVTAMCCSLGHEILDLGLRTPATRSFWLPCVAVESADNATARATELGGKILRSSSDVFDWGRMALIEDSAPATYGGAVFAIWEPKNCSGIAIPDADASLFWAEMITGRRKHAQFYEDLFGWQLVPSKEHASPDLHIHKGEQLIGGIHLNLNIPPGWLVYFRTGDSDSSKAKARELGAIVDRDVCNKTVVWDRSTIFSLTSLNSHLQPPGACFGLLGNRP